MGYTQPNDFFSDGFGRAVDLGIRTVFAVQAAVEPFEGFESSLHFLTSLKLRFQAA